MSLLITDNCDDDDDEMAAGISHNSESDFAAF